MPGFQSFSRVSCIILYRLNLQPAAQGLRLLKSTRTTVFSQIFIEIFLCYQVVWWSVGSCVCSRSYKVKSKCVEYLTLFDEKSINKIRSKYIRRNSMLINLKKIYHFSKPIQRRPLFFVLSIFLAYSIQIYLEDSPKTCWVEKCIASGFGLWHVSKPLSLTGVTLQQMDTQVWHYNKWIPKLIYQKCLTN